MAPLSIRRDDGAEVRRVGVPHQPVQASMTVQGQRAFAISQEPAAGESYHRDRSAGRITLKRYVRESRDNTTIHVMRK